MKKSVLILSAVLIVVCIAVYGFMDRNNSETKELATLEQVQTSTTEETASITTVPERPEKKIFRDFIYDVGPRFNPIKKTDLAKARSFSDFIAEEHANRITYYTFVSVIVLNGDEKTKIRETGNDGDLTAAQIKLLQSFDHSSNLMVWADYQEHEFHTGELQFSTWTPYLTVVPETQATYNGGKDVLMDFLKEKSKEFIAHVDEDKLKPAKLLFTVTSEGSVTNVSLDRSSNYTDVDQNMIELITKTAGNWEPAKDEAGNKVDQVLTVSFGLMGC
ncbi:MAG: energy transducer TonB [Bacteroidia bacterium]|nr:energy transducer TonB [Bacteroidia bacterium]